MEDDTTKPVEEQMDDTVEETVPVPVVQGDIMDSGHSRAVEQRTVENVMEDSYLRYSMSVIVARALPDVRDGMKPVHRRILYNMNRMGITPTGKTVKSAQIVGSHG